MWELREERLGFRALQERCEGMSSSVLRDRLAALVGAGLIEANDDRRYRLSAHGAGMLDALRPLSAWAEAWGGGTYRSPLSG